MREFKFNNTNVCFKFGEDVFSAPLAKASDVMGEIGKLLIQASEETEKIEENVNKVLEKIDEIFGEGSIDKIFAGRDIEVVDVCDLVNFISEEIMEKKTEREQNLKVQADKINKRKFVSVHTT